MLGNRELIAGAAPDHVELAEHVVELAAEAEDPGAGAERRRERCGKAVRVDDRDGVVPVNRPAEAP